MPTSFLSSHSEGLNDAAGGAIRNPEQVVAMFRKRDFNVMGWVAETSAKGMDSIVRQTNQLDDCQATIQTQLHEEVVSCHERLLEHTLNLDFLDRELGSLRDDVKETKAVMNSIKQTTMAPFRRIKKSVERLERGQQASLLLRKCQRFEQEARKLRAQVDPSTGMVREYSKSSSTLYELESLQCGSDKQSLESLTVLKRELPWLRRQGQFVREQAQNDLLRGIKEFNQVLISQSCQAFFNLQTLWQKIDAVLTVDLLAMQVEPALHVLLSHHTGGAPASRNAASGKVNVVPQLEPFLQAVLITGEQVQFLDEVLRERSDPLTHKKLAAEWNYVSLFDIYWNKLWSEMWRGKMQKVSKKVKDNLIACFGTFSRLLEHRVVEPLGMGTNFNLRKIMVAALQELVDHFVGKSHVRCQEPIAVMFPSAGTKTNLSDLPTVADLKRFAQMLVEEINGDAAPFVIKNLIRNVRNAVMTATSKIEALVDQKGLTCDTDVGFTQSHVRNARLFILLSQLIQILRENLSHTICHDQGSPTRIIPAPVWQYTNGLQKSMVEAYFHKVEAKWKRETRDQWYSELSARVTKDSANGIKVSSALEDFLALVNQIQRGFLIHYSQNAPYLGPFVREFIGAFLLSAFTDIFSKTDALTLVKTNISVKQQLNTDMELLLTGLESALGESGTDEVVRVCRAFAKCLHSPTEGLPNLKVCHAALKPVVNAGQEEGEGSELYVLTQLFLQSVSDGVL